MAQSVECPQCGNAVEQDRPCPYCAYADSVGIPGELVARPVAAGQQLAINYDFAILNGFIDNKFLLQKALEQNFSPDMLELNLAQKLARHLISLFESEPKTEAWDKIIVRTKLRQKGVLTASLDQFFSKVIDVPVPTLEQLITYLNLLKNQFALRCLRSTGESITRFIQDPSAGDKSRIDRFVAESIDNLHTIQRLSVNKHISLVKNEMQGIIEDIQYRQAHGEKKILGFTMRPFNILDQTLSGLRKGFLYAMAGAPRRGKTNLTLDIATYVARENNIPVLFFTWEQTKRNLTYRLLSKESYINPDTLQRKQLLGDPVMKAKLNAGLKKMSDYQDRLYIIESTKEDTVDRVRGHAYNVMQEFDTNNIAIFVDYIQKMPSRMDIANEKVKVEAISTDLKALSIELNCPIVAISSLSKEGCNIDQTENDERPHVFHCKGSGDIEYDLDVCCILAKDWADTNELYTQLRHKAEAAGKDVHRLPKIDVVNLHIDKNRDAPEGVLGTIQYFFFIEENKFIELGYKLDTDVYRFNKIENLVNMLIERDFIKFYDIDASAGPQGKQGIEPSELTSAQHRKIRLRR